MVRPMFVVHGGQLGGFVRRRLHYVSGPSLAVAQATHIS